RYAANENVLILGYQNGNIDLLSQNGIANIDLVKEQNLLQDKAISAISLYNGLAYLATDFGIVVVDLSRQVLEEVYREIGPDGQQPEVYSTHVFNDSIFAVTSLGFQSAPLATGANLLDFNNWIHLDTPIDLTKIAGSVELMILSDDETVYRYEEGVFTVVTDDLTNIEKIAIQPDETITAIASGIGYRIAEGAPVPIINEGSSNLKDVLIIGNITWLADSVEGLRQLSAGNFQSLIPNGPFSDRIQHLVFQDSGVFAFGPYRNSAFEPLSRQGYSFYSEGLWNEINTSVFTNPNDISGSYLLSYNSGIQLRTGNERLTGTPFTTNNPSGDIILTAIEQDGEDLWVANYNSDLPLHKLSADGNWQSFDLSGQAEDITRLAVSGLVWIETRSSSGITAFNPDTEDITIINQNNSDLPSSTINDLVIDLDDELWIATNAGVAFIPSASAEFSNFNAVIKPIYENNFLFRDEVINCIAVDPGNRKWIGTNTGAWLLEEAGESLVVRFTESNSPLPSNTVLEIAINSESGEVFFITEKGMVSYRSDASQSTEVHSDVRIFPNPVRPGFSGLVGFSGLATDVRLKITDVSGKLIREIEANGGGASWNLRDLNGNRAQTGIYLVFSADREGVETYVGKLAVVN
ncbi:MAG: hypothetical protein WBA74_13495, partial [Cyclobacteriaceae bacterium]